MVVVPNDALVHYVDRVLPTLGVEGVPVTTFGRWAAQRRRHALSEASHARSATRRLAVVSRAKRHPAMLRAIDAARSARDGARSTSGSATRWRSGPRATSSSAPGSHRTKGTPPPDARVTALASWLAGKRTLRGDAVASSLPDVTRSALEQLGHELRSIVARRPRHLGRAPHDRERLAESVRRHRRASARASSTRCTTGASARRASAPRASATARAAIDAEDAALLLRSWQTLRGPLVDADGKPLRLVAPLRRRGPGREPGRASRSARSHRAGAEHHARGRRRPANARRRRGAGRVRLGGAARRSSAWRTRRSSR